MKITDEQLRVINIGYNGAEITFTDAIGRDFRASFRELAADLLSARQTIANLTTERNAWREDADRLHHHYCHLVIDDSPCDCGAVGIEDFHRQLHERYSTEKSDTDKGE